MGRFSHHAAVTHFLVFALIEDAIKAHWSHVHIADLGPAEELVVEVKPVFEIRCVEFVPTVRSWGGRWRAHRRGHGGVGSKDHDGGALGIGHDSEAKHAGHIGCRPQKIAPGFDDLFYMRVNVIDGDVTDPGGVPWDSQHSGQSYVAHVECGVV